MIYWYGALHLDRHMLLALDPRTRRRATPFSPPRPPPRAQRGQTKSDMVNGQSAEAGEPRALGRLHRSPSEAKSWRNVLPGGLVHGNMESDEVWHVS